VDCYSASVGSEFVNSYNNTHKGGVQWAVRLEIGCHMDAHSNFEMTGQSGKVQAVLGCVQRRAIFWRQARIEGANADSL
jgi:hypothetical protein